MYAPGYTPPPGGMTDTGQRMPGTLADQIRADIARLQRLLSEIEGSGYQNYNNPEIVKRPPTTDERFNGNGNMPPAWS